MRNRTSIGLLVAVAAAGTFGMSGAFMKPLLEAGWSPAAAVTLRALVGGIVLLPIALVLLRGKWDALWRGRWRVLLMALIGVAGTQLVYFAAVQRIAVGTAILIEYMAPLLLVAFVWLRTRRMPKAVVLVGSVVVIGTVVLVVGSGGSLSVVLEVSVSVPVSLSVSVVAGLVGVQPTTVEATRRQSRGWVRG